eukprot:7407012-Pyramimonas_sp.AAC.1
MPRTGSVIRAADEAHPALERRGMSARALYAREPRPALPAGGADARDGAAVGAGLRQLEAA